MDYSTIHKSEIVIFKPKGKLAEFQVVLDAEQDTVWVTEQQIMALYGKSRRTIEYHIKNIFEEGELDKEATWRNFRQVQKEGEREVTRKISTYNLDVVISVGYRVKSKVGIEFRKWATHRLKEYLLKGYSINKELLLKEQNKVLELKTEINYLSEIIYKTENTLADGFLSIINHYSKTFELLEKYDKNNLSSKNLSKDIIFTINYMDVTKAIQKLKKEKLVTFLELKKIIH